MEDIESEDKEFEDNIREAIKRIERKKIKALLKDIKEEIRVEDVEFENKEREKAEINLNVTEHEISPIKKRKIISFNSNWWKYAIAACIVIGLPLLFVYQTETNESKLSDKDTSEDSILYVVDSVVVDYKEKEIQPFNIKIENIEAGTSKKLNGQVIIETGKTLSYYFTKNKLNLKSSKTLKIKSVISLEDKIYIRINKSFYLISPNRNYQPLLPVSDLELIKKLKELDVVSK